VSGEGEPPALQGTEMTVHGNDEDGDPNGPTNQEVYEADRKTALERFHEANPDSSGPESDEDLADYWPT